MSNDNGHKTPLQFPVAVPLIGQPFTIKAFTIPVNVILTCQCDGEQTEVAILSSLPAACARCGKVYTAALNPATNRVEVRIATP